LLGSEKIPQVALSFLPSFESKMEDEESTDDRPPRSHGFQLPVHPFQIISVIIILYLTTVFLAFVPFLLGDVLSVVTM
jgi:hypothetical protein